MHHRDLRHPVPRGLAEIVATIAPQKDLDALSQTSVFAIPATSEGIIQVVEPFSGIDQPIDVQSEAVGRLVMLLQKMT